jgi:hypothetical protein
VILSKREKLIAFGTAGAVGLLVLNSFILEPYSEAMDDIHTKTDRAAAELNEDASLFASQKTKQKDWRQMQDHGLKTDESQADSQLQHAILRWAQLAGVNTQVLKSDSAKKEGDFDVIGYRITATGSMQSISRLLWALETATIPIRISDVRVTPEREGTDALSVQVGVSTISAPPEDVTPSAAPSTAPAVRPATQGSADAELGGNTL